MCDVVLGGGGGSVCLDSIPNGELMLDLETLFQLNVLEDFEMEDDNDSDKKEGEKMKVRM